MDTHDQLLHLPTEMLFYICEFVDPVGLCRLASVSHSLLELSCSDHIWKRHYAARWPLLQHIANTVVDTDSPIPTRHRSWQKAFADRYRFDRLYFDATPLSRPSDITNALPANTKPMTAREYILRGDRIMQHLFNDKASSTLAIEPANTDEAVDAIKEQRLLEQMVQSEKDDDVFQYIIEQYVSAISLASAEISAREAAAAIAAVAAASSLKKSWPGSLYSPFTSFNTLRSSANGVLSKHLPSSPIGSPPRPSPGSPLQQTRAPSPADDTLCTIFLAESSWACISARYAMKKDSQFFPNGTAKRALKAVCASQRAAIDALFRECFVHFERAADPRNPQLPDVLCMWGDRLHDYSRRFGDTYEADRFMELACEKYQKSSELKKDNFIALDYWGLALDRMAKIRLSRWRSATRAAERARRAGQSDAAGQWEAEAARLRADVDTLFAAAAQKYSAAHAVRPDDGFVLCHWAASLQAAADAVATRPGGATTAAALYAECFMRFEQVTRLLSDDSFVQRNWADALHEAAKNLRRQVAEQARARAAGADVDGDDAADEAAAQRLIEESMAKYAESVRMQPNYTNALNSWGLLLGNEAKRLDGDAADALWAQSYQKFAESVASRQDDVGFVVCNWAMTLVCQSKSKRRRGLVEEAEVLIAEAKAKLEPLVQAGDTWSLFCMARLNAAIGNEAQCREWLERCMAEGACHLWTASEQQLSYFESVQNSEWFQEMLLKEPPPSV